MLVVGRHGEPRWSIQGECAVGSSPASPPSTPPRRSSRGPSSSATHSRCSPASSTTKGRTSFTTYPATAQRGTERRDHANADVWCATHGPTPRDAPDMPPNLPDRSRQGMMGTQSTSAVPKFASPRSRLPVGHHSSCNASRYRRSRTASRCHTSKATECRLSGDPGRNPLAGAPDRRRAILPRAPRFTHAHDLNLRGERGFGCARPAQPTCGS